MKILLSCTNLSLVAIEFAPTVVRDLRHSSSVMIYEDSHPKNQSITEPMTTAPELQVDLVPLERSLSVPPLG